MTLIVVVAAGPALAQSRSGRDPAGVSEGEADATTTAPVLQTRVEATYPAGALRDHIEGSVSVELDVDENGEVTDARVLAPAGHGFDAPVQRAPRKAWSDDMPWLSRKVPMDTWRATSALAAFTRV